MNALAEPQGKCPIGICKASYQSGLLKRPLMTFNDQKQN